MLLTFIALEWKTYDNAHKYDTSLNVEDDLTEEAPIFQLKTLPPPPVTPIEIEVVEDDEEIEETFIESTETDQEEEIIDVADVIVDEIPEDVEIIITVVEEKPIFPGCENEKDKLDCFQKMMGRHINKTFDILRLAARDGN